MTTLRTACALLLTALGTPALAQDGLRPYVAEYELLQGGSLAGHATITLEKGPTEGTWQLSSHTRSSQGLAALTGMDVRETSTFRSSAEGLSCQQYNYRLSGLRKRERQVSCDDSAITSRDHRNEYRFSAQSGVLDRQIVSLALARDLAAGKRGTLNYPVVDRERLEPHTYRVLKEETITVPAGTLRTISVERLRENSDRTTTTWFDLNQGLAPVRIVQQDDGDGYELRLTSLKQ